MQPGKPDQFDDSKRIYGRFAGARNLKRIEERHDEETGVRTAGQSLDLLSGLVRRPLRPAATRSWSHRRLVKDILAHVTTWEEQALKHLPSVLRGQTPPRYSVTYGGIDAFNARMTEQKENFSLGEVHGQLSGTHRNLLDFLETVPDKYFAGETRFRHRLRLDTYGHYPKHARAIGKWREALEPTNLGVFKLRLVF